MFKNSNVKMALIIAMPIILRILFAYLPLWPLFEDVAFFGTATWAVYTLVKFLKK